MTLLLRNSDAEAFEDSHVRFHFAARQGSSTRLMSQCLFHSVQFFGSADGGSAVAALLLLGRELVSHFDGMEGVVDGGATSPAPGP